MAIFMVRLQEDPPVFLADWKGDPGRTYDVGYAKTFRSIPAARGALTRARNRSGRPLAEAIVLSAFSPEVQLLGQTSDLEAAKRRKVEAL